jgi:predicted acylesterase/phospholipase RssA
MIGKATSNAGAQYAAALARRRVALALQGGGSHGAFTWGVLDRLLDDETIEIIGVTGTSAGAMNSAVLVDGLVRGGPKQARTKLRRYWEAVGSMPGFGSYFSNMSGEQAVTTPLENVPAEAAAYQGEVDRLEALESFKKITAPFDGIVTARETDIGALINAGSGTGGGSGPELFRVADLLICPQPMTIRRGNCLRN